MHTNSPAVFGPVEQSVRPCLVVHGDGVTDDSAAIQAFLDGDADLVHADGAAYQWPGTSGRKYAIGTALVLGGRKRDKSIKQPKLRPGQWIGRA